MAARETPRRAAGSSAALAASAREPVGRTRKEEELVAAAGADEIEVDVVEDAEELETELEDISDDEEIEIPGAPSPPEEEESEW